MLVTDCVIMRPNEDNAPPFIARIDKLEANHRDQVTVTATWYYRPEETNEGRRPFHGEREIFLSDHIDSQSAETIEDLCFVHTLEEYMALETIRAEDFFSRFEYRSGTGTFTPARVKRYCICRMPYNPDKLMVKCEGCKDWFHPECLEMSDEDAKNLNPFLCPNCVTNKNVKGKSIRSSDGSSSSAASQVQPKRRRT